MTTLKLGNNALNCFNAEELKIILDAISPHVTRISLKGNDIFKDKSPEETKDFLEVLGEHRKRLDHRSHDKLVLASVSGPLNQMTHSTLFSYGKYVDDVTARRIASFLGANEAEAGIRILDITHAHGEFKRAKPAPATPSSDPRAAADPDLSSPEKK